MSGLDRVNIYLMDSLPTVNLHVITYAMVSLVWILVHAYCGILCCSEGSFVVQRNPLLFMPQGSTDYAWMAAVPQGRLCRRYGNYGRLYCGFGDYGRPYCGS